jgi:hypothetical protein
MNAAQEAALRRLSENYGVKFRAEWFTPAYDLPPGYVAGWIGGPEVRRLYVGVDQDGRISS